MKTENEKLIEELRARVADLEAQRDVLLLLVLTQDRRVHQLEDMRDAATMALERARRERQKRTS